MTETGPVVPPAYAELQVTTNFSFLHGGSHGDELARQAAVLGLSAIAVADRNTLAGVVRAHFGARDAGIRFVPGARLDFTDGTSLLCYPTDRAAYGRLSRLLTLGRRQAEKGECNLTLDDAAGAAEGQIVIALSDGLDPVAESPFLSRVAAIYGDRAYLAANMLMRGDDQRRLQVLMDLSAAHSLPLVACNDVHYHIPERRQLQDVLTCIRHGVTLDTAGRRLFPNGERHLKTAAEMRDLFARCPDAVTRTREIVDRCRFSLDELAYEYPDEICVDGETTQQTLTRLVGEGAAKRYGQAMPASVRKQLDHELQLIEELNYAPYFLTVYDIVRFARSQGILCQGRGSAANSIVCYCLWITSVDPVKLDLLFERFISAERNEPPDIDVDFEHERREEVIQYIYEKYGRDRAGLAATVISYRSKSAIREVAKVLGLSVDVTDAIRRTIWREGVEEHRLLEAGLDPTDPTLAMAIRLARELYGFPRHLSQHVGGFVIARGLLSELVPIENAAMEDRTVIQWDKDDLESLGLMKVDVLGLGMLSCIRKAFEFMESHYGRTLELATVPADDSDVYDMLCNGDSVGVFQVESRAQMAMLPRLKPRSFYDLVIEVAIVRPGPIQGDMVHPYLRRRDKKEEVDYPSEALRGVLEKTLGVPLFQEQAMKIAIVGAGFTPSEADRLRRAMATFRRNGTIDMFQEKLINGMLANGYERDFAERCFEQIKGFGDYGFPESHAASFALLVYVSSWLKCHYPDVFAAAILNSQPMGFYAPAQLVRDAQEHGVEARPVDVNYSHWDHQLEPLAAPVPNTGRRTALRLGFRLIKGLREDVMDRLVDRRGGGYRTIGDLQRRAELDLRSLQLLAAADAFASMGLDRRQADWEVRALEPDTLPLFHFAEEHLPAGSNQPVELLQEPEVVLPRLTAGEQVVADYESLKLSLKGHPCGLLRDQFDTLGWVTNDRLPALKDGAHVRLGGLVLIRQRPGTATGVVFATLEDETGVANVVIWPHVAERFRRIMLGARLMGVIGRQQKEGKVIHVIADRLLDMSGELNRLVMVDPADGGLPGQDDVVNGPVSSRRRVAPPAIRNRPARPAAVMPKGRNFH